MRDPYVSGLRASSSLRPTARERVGALISGLIVACAVLVVVSFVVAFVAVGLTTPRGQLAAALVVFAAAIGGWAWRSR